MMPVKISHFLKYPYLVKCNAENPMLVPKTFFFFNLFYWSMGSKSLSSTVLGNSLQSQSKTIGQREKWSVNKISGDSAKGKWSQGAPESAGSILSLCQEKIVKPVNVHLNYLWQCFIDKSFPFGPWVAATECERQEYEKPCPVCSERLTRMSQSWKC